MLIVVYAGITADFAWFWVLLTAVLEGGAVLIRYGRNHPGIFPGWLGTVIMVAVRQQDVSDQYRRNMARQALYQRLAPQAKEDWLQELRAGAYIQVLG